MRRNHEVIFKNRAEFKVSFGNPIDRLKMTEGAGRLVPGDRSVGFRDVSAADGLHEGERDSGIGHLLRHVLSARHRVLEVDDVGRNRSLIDIICKHIAPGKCRNENTIKARPLMKSNYL